MSFESSFRYDNDGMRGDDEGQVRFRQILSNLRNYCVYPSDHAHLLTRLKTQLTPNRIASFKNAPRSVANHHDERNINVKFLRELSHTVCTVVAVNYLTTSRKMRSQGRRWPGEQSLISGRS